MSSYRLDSVIYFGKFKGKTMKEIIDTGQGGKGYLLWAASKIPNFKLEKDVEVYLKTGKVIEVKEDLSMYDRKIFWDRIVIDGPLDNVPF